MCTRINTFTCFSIASAFIATLLVLTATAHVSMALVLIPLKPLRIAIAATRPAGATIITQPAKSSISSLVYPSSSASAADIKRWIHDLLSDEYEVRHASAKKLLAAGDSAVPAMKAALAGLTTPEMRHLLRQDIRTNFHRDLILGPLITLSAKNISTEKAFQMVCKQAGSTANVIQQGNLPQVTIEAKNAPFWQVMQRLSVLTGVSPVAYYNNNPGFSLMLNGILNASDIVSFDGGFAVVAQNISYNRTVDFSQPTHPATNAFSLNLWLLSIPGRIGPLQIQSPVLTSAVDNHGNSLISATPGNAWYGNQLGAVNNFAVTLNWPTKPGTLITTLKGYVPVVASLDRKMLDLKIKSKGTTRQNIAGVEVSAGNLKLVNGIWQFTLKVKVPLDNGMNMTTTAQNIVSQMGNFYNGPIHNAAGAVINPNGWTTTGNWQQGTLYTIPIQGGAKPAEIILPVYTRQETLKVQFDLKNIPMP